MFPWGGGAGGGWFTFIILSYKMSFVSLIQVLYAVSEQHWDSCQVSGTVLREHTRIQQAEKKLGVYSRNYRYSFEIH